MTIDRRHIRQRPHAFVIYLSLERESSNRCVKVQSRFAFMIYCFSNLA